MICIKCGKEKSIDDFYDRHKTNSVAGRKKSVCKICQIETTVASNKTRRKQHYDRIVEIKLRRGCIDCGFNSHAAALHFDHKHRAEKRFIIAQSLLYSWKTILKEIAKCDIRCANCHAIKTFQAGEHKHG